MALTDVAPVLAKDFVTLKLDTDRMPGAKDVLQRYQGKPGGVPWFVFVGPDGQGIITSDDPAKGNVGFPAQDSEIAHFKVMLQKVATNITSDEIDALCRSLVAFRDVKLPPR
jgi:uncharacterized protein YyaL (SSP411 family)